MRYTFLILFGLLFFGLNAVQAQSCCSKAKATTASVEKKSCSDSKATTATVTGNCSESAATASTAATARSVSLLPSVDLRKACDPSTCDLSKCDLSKCDPGKCDPTKCPKLGALKASNTTTDKSKKTKTTTAAL